MTGDDAALCSTAGRPATGGCRFGRDDARRWATVAGTLVADGAPFDVYHFIRNGDRPRLSPQAHMAVGIYVVVDDDDAVCYIGKVCRDDPAGLQERFRRHHKATADWAALWVLRFVDGTDDDVVCRFEERMIAGYRPVGNAASVGAAERAARAADASSVADSASLTLAAPPITFKQVTS